jgi:hypothetical protein
MPRPEKSPRLALLALLSLLAFLGAAPRLQAEVLGSGAGFYLDLPEGYTLVDGDQKSRFAFLSPDQGMEFDLFAYAPERYADARALATDAIRKLASTGEEEAFLYQGRDCIFAELNFSTGGKARKGYAIFMGLAKGGQSVALLAYSEKESFDNYADFILSCLDSFSADRAALRAPGPVSQYILPWPAERAASKTLKLGPSLGGGSLDLPWSEEEAQQEEGTAAREFRVLQAYGGTQDLWKPAWARAYRMIYRESAARLDRLAIELDRILPEDPTDAARAVLTWTQGFVYERDQKGIDFVDPLSSAYEARGDCDSRAMVAAIILERRGIDTILMVSSVYSHALLGVDVPGGGQRFPFEGKNYLVGETTAKVGLGMIAADQADWKNWIGIQLGDR